MNTPPDLTEAYGDEDEDDRAAPVAPSLEKDAPAVITLPPNILLLAIVAGVILNWLFPFPLGHGWGALGLLLVIGAMGVIFWSMRLFKVAGTNVRPDQPTLSIVVSGPYAYSRNPIYFAFLMGYAGLAMMIDAPVMLLVLIPLWYILDRHVIKPEEEYLEAKFGDEYTDYMSHVDRWLW